MRAYYELNAVVPGNHQLTINLPEDIPVGEVKIAVIYEVLEQAADKQSLMTAFLNQLPLNASGLTRDEINNHLVQERQGWD